MADKPIARMWVFASGSNPDKNHQTLQYTDGTISCACPGWCRRVTAEGYRSCRHTRSVDAGTADKECISSVDYTKNNKTTKSVTKQQSFKALKSEDTEAPLKRKIRW